MITTRFACLAMAITAAFGLSACTTAGAPKVKNPVALESETIRYETAPCFGTCPAYAVTISPDGKGTFEGKRFTAVTGTRTFVASPTAYRAFATKLAPYRPAGNEMLYQPGTRGCENAPTDMPSVDIVWTELSGGRQHLNLYYGCGPEAMRNALRSAPESLPIGSFIKR
jgi:hypothetical protein